MKGHFIHSLDPFQEHLFALITKPKNSERPKSSRYAFIDTHRVQILEVRFDLRYLSEMPSFLDIDPKC